jgi:hypothetical protein
VDWTNIPTTEDSQSWRKGDPYRQGHRRCASLPGTTGRAGAFGTESTKFSATLAFYNRLEAHTICDLTAAVEPCSTTSNPCALLVEGITLKFPLTFGGSPRTSLENVEIVLSDGLDEGAVYCTFTGCYTLLPTSSQERIVKTCIKISYWYLQLGTSIQS